MDDLADQFSALKTRVDELERQHAFQLRQMEISLYQSEMQVQMALRSMGGARDRTTTYSGTKIPFSRDTAWKHLVLRQTGEPRRFFKALFFKKGGDVREQFKKFVYRKNGSPRPHFARWLHTKANSQK